MNRTYDLIVIGSGTAGTGVAFRCRKAGWNVAVVDERPPGGTCAQRGCDPKKVLTGAAELADWAGRMSGRGFAASRDISWDDLIAFKKSFTDGVSESRREAFDEEGIDFLSGPAQFDGPDTLRIGDDLLLKAERFVVATGAVPMPLPFSGAEHLIDSEAFMELPALAKNIVFVGGGFIGMEFAHLAARAGSQVQVLEMENRPLSGFDPDLVDRLVELSQKAGVAIRTGATVTGVEPLATGFRVLYEVDGKTTETTCDRVVHGAGRIPNTEKLNLEAAGVPVSRDGIAVNEFLQSPGNDRVYAAGDVAATAGLALTPVAAYEAKVVADNLLEGNNTRANYPVVPSAVFTVPPLAMAGLTEDEARRKGIAVTVRTTDMDGWYTYRRTGESGAMGKLIFGEGTDRILGAHVLGSQAEHLINLLAVAIRFGLPAADLRTMLYAYPSGESDLAYLIPKTLSDH